MTVPATILPIEYIVFDPQKNQPMLVGTRFSVAFLATFLENPEWTVERMVANYPLTAAQIYAAWSYYHDHHDEIDRILKEEAERGQQVGKPLSSLSGYDEFMARHKSEVDPEK
jgi:uncharacterized protein (DUF433 family)